MTRAADDHVTTSPAAGQAGRRGVPGPGLDRFTLAIALGALALVGVLVGLILARPNQAQPMDESRPAGVLHNYYLARLNDDPRTAYGYLSAEARGKLPYERFAARQAPRYATGTRRTIDDERIEGDTARVTVRTSSGGGSGFFPFLAEEHSYQRTVVLRREDGAWKLTDPDQAGW